MDGFNSFVAICDSGIEAVVILTNLAEGLTSLNNGVICEHDVNVGEYFCEVGDDSDVLAFPVAERHFVELPGGLSIISGGLFNVVVFANAVEDPHNCVNRCSDAEGTISGENNGMSDVLSLSQLAGDVFSSDTALTELDGLKGSDRILLLVNGDSGSDSLLIKCSDNKCVLFGFSIISVGQVADRTSFISDFNNFIEGRGDAGDSDCVVDSGEELVSSAAGFENSERLRCSLFAEDETAGLRGECPCSFLALTV